MKAISSLFAFLLFLTCGGATADEAAVLAKLERSVSSPKSFSARRDRASGALVEIRLNAPDLKNGDLALFNELKTLQRLTISHAGYAKGKKTGVDFSGVALLRKHPSLRYFSAGGAVGKPYLAALAQLTNVPELYVQTTASVDADWAPIGTMRHLTYLGIRVRNDRMSKLTEGMFRRLMPLKNLERFLLSEMTFRDPMLFVKFITTRPKLQQLSIRRCTKLPQSALDAIHTAMPDLEIEISN